MYICIYNKICITLKIISINKEYNSFEDQYVAAMKNFWEEYDLVEEMYDAGFYLGEFFIEQGNYHEEDDADPNLLAAAVNLILIEHNQLHLIDIGYEAFQMPLKMLKKEYGFKDENINDLADKIRKAMVKHDFDKEILNIVEDDSEYTKFDVFVSAMSKFWDKFDLHQELFDAGFDLGEFISDETNYFDDNITSPNLIAAAVNYILIEHNDLELVDIGFDPSHGPFKILEKEFSFKLSVIEELVTEIKLLMTNKGYDQDLLDSGEITPEDVKLGNLYALLDKLSDFWEEFDLQKQMYDAGYELTDFIYVETSYLDDDTFDLNLLAAATNYILIKHNQAILSQIGFEEFDNPLKFLENEFNVKPKEIKKLAAAIEDLFEDNDFDVSLLAYDEDATDFEDAPYIFDDEQKSKFDFAITPNLYHYKILLNDKATFENKDVIKALDQAKDRLLNMMEDDVSRFVDYKLYDIYRESDTISFSIYINPLLLSSLEKILKEKYHLDFELRHCGTLDTNLFAPESHYTTFMQTYRDMNFDTIQNEAQFKTEMDRFAKVSDDERHKANPNAREDDEFGAILLYDLPKDDGIAKARSILKTNPQNIEARILIAGWEPDLEKRIDLLQEILNPAKVSFDYDKVERDNMWWGYNHTRPYMRAMFALGVTYADGMYEEDAIDIFEKMLSMNKNDNQGARFELMYLYIDKQDKKGIGSLCNAYSDDEYNIFFTYSRVYCYFMRYGKGSKTEKVILRSIEANPAFACHLAQYDFDEFTNIIELDEEQIPQMLEQSDFLKNKVSFLFKNQDLLKYYKKVIDRYLDE